LLTIYRSNKVEWLADVLCEQLYNSPPKVTENIEIIIGNWSTSRWLSDQISYKTGIASQIKYHLPSSYIKKTVNELLGHEIEEIDPWKPLNMTWAIISKLDNLTKMKEGKPIKEWLNRQEKSGEAVDKNIWKLTYSIASTLDDYIQFRPEIIEHWLKLEDNSTNKLEKLQENELWQIAILNLIIQELKKQPLSTKIKKVITEINKTNISKNLVNKKLYIFGISSLSPIQIDFIKSLSLFTDIKMYLVSPCPELWKRINIRENNKINIDNKNNIQNPKPENILGRLGAEFDQLLEGTETIQSSEIEEINFYALQKEIAKSKNKEPTLLEQIQEGMLNEDYKKLQTNSNDDSIIFMAASGKRRQLELIKDKLLEWFSKDRELTPGDILIISPDIYSFAHLIPSIFESNNKLCYLPWILKDNKKYESSGLINNISNFLELGNNRLTATSINKIISNKTFMIKHDINEEDIILINKCLKESGFRWGIDKEERGGNDENSLEWCLNRWIKSLIYIENNKEVNDIISPYYSNINPNELIRWWEIISEISTIIKSIRNPKTIKEWSNFIISFTNDYNDSLKYICKEKKILNTIINTWKSVAFKCKIKIDSTLISLILKEYITNRESSTNSQTGKITFGNMDSLGFCPYKKIIMMGLDEEIYPKNDEKPRFNILERKKILGDITSNQKDKYILLEAILSARENLFITWNNRNESTGDELEISNPIKQLLNLLENKLTKNEFNELYIKPPANSYDIKNFIKANRNIPLSCDPFKLKTVINKSKNHLSYNTGIAYPLKWENTELSNESSINYHDIIKFLHKPQIDWLNRNEIYPNEWDDIPKDIDQLEIENIVRNSLILKRIMDIADNKIKDSELTEINNNIWLEYTDGKGIMPIKSAKDIEINILNNRYQKLFNLIEKIGKLRIKKINVENTLVETFWIDKYQLVIDFNKTSYRSIMKCWLNHIYLSKAEIDNLGSIVISMKNKNDFDINYKFKELEQSEAKYNLEKLKQIVSINKNHCWPVPPRSGWEYALANMKNKPNANEIFNKIWKGVYNIKGEREKDEMVICFGNRIETKEFLNNDVFKSCLNKLYNPILENLIF